MSKKGKNRYLAASHKPKNPPEQPARPHKSFLLTESVTYPQKTTSQPAEQSPEIAAHLSLLHPFSRDPQQISLEHKLKEVVSLHQKSTQSRSPSPQKPLSRRTIPSPLQQSQFILTHSVKRRKGGGRCKTVQDEREDPESEMAKQMISECRKEKQQFRDTLKRFQLLIQDAGEDYLEREVINCPPQMVRKCGGLTKLASKGQVCNRYEDALASFERILPKRKQQLYGLDKQDYYSWLKSSNRLINCQRQQAELQRRNEEQRWSGQKAVRGGGLMVEQYFRRGRKVLLRETFEGSRT